MKTKLLIVVVCIVLLASMISLSFAEVQVPPDGEYLTDQGIQAVTCLVYDEFGNPITSAHPGDVIMLKIEHDAIPGLTRNFIFKVPSNDPNYKDLFYYSKYYAGASYGGSIYMKINDYSYIEGMGLFIGTVPGLGSCVKPLQIVP